MSKAKRVLEARKNKHTAGYFVFNMLVHQRQKFKYVKKISLFPSTLKQHFLKEAYT